MSIHFIYITGNEKKQKKNLKKAKQNMNIKFQ